MRVLNYCRMGADESAQGGTDVAYPDNDKAKKS